MMARAISLHDVISQDPGAGGRYFPPNDGTVPPDYTASHERTLKTETAGSRKNLKMESTLSSETFVSIHLQTLKKEAAGPRKRC
jgi:hypothetical protein